MAIDVDALKSATDLVTVVGNVTPLVKRGAEWLGRCQSGWHEDNNPSMWVNPRKGIIKCFACGWSTDLIGFVQHVYSLDFKGACEWLGAKPSLSPALSAPPRRPVLTRITSKPPPDAESPNMLIRALGPPSKIWPYRDSDGQVLGYVARYDTDEGKEIRCWTWGQVGDAEPCWACGHWNQKRPLYGLDRLAARPDDKVCVCEGEKAADAAGRLLPGYVAVSWPAGAQSILKADWLPLAGRTVLLWPDADEPGWKCMQTLAAVLAGSGGLDCAVRILDSNQMQPGWDAADAESEGWTTEDLIEWARPRASDYVPPALAPAALQAPVGVPEPTPSPDSDPAPVVAPARVRLAAVDGQRVSDYEGEDDLPMTLSESGIALEFVNECCSDLRYVHEWEAWLRWDGHRWARESSRQTPTQRIRALSYGIKHRPEARELTSKAKQQFERKAFFFSCLDLAEYDRRVILTPDLFDANPMQLCTPAGTVDLTTGKLCAPDPLDYITRCTTVAPAEGPHPLFDQVIACASNGDAELRSFIWRWLGYLLTGSVQEETFLFLYGKPACGKSTLVEAIAGILGLPQDAGYAAKVPVELFTETKHDRSGDTHVLHGVRFAFCAETEENRHWKSALLKEVTGGDTLTGERKYENIFSFRPTHKLWIHGNHKPHMRTADEGLRRRMHLLEYASDIPEDKRDLEFKSKLAGEYPAILHSMIRGCLKWHEFGGLRKPQHITDTVSEYFSEEDTFGNWIVECCTEEPTASCGSTEAYKAYQIFCDQHGERPPSHKRFSMMLKQKGYEITKSGTKRIVGISLIPPVVADRWDDRY